MTPSVIVAPNATSIRAMMTPYLEELTPGAPVVYPGLSLYWQDPDRTPYLIRVDLHDAGFALVRQHLGGQLHEMAEFYVAREQRRKGIGGAAARTVFDRHPGYWHLQILGDNVAAQRFWRSIVPGSVDEAQHVAANGRRFMVMQFHWSAVTLAQRRP